ncbi:MAG: FtsX-like permease family protein, partial [Acidimicrobiia bacterium]|nr:FtsX-like permease family protein [Acidimicrobiia bacterium]
TLHASLGEIFQEYASGSDLVVAAPTQVGDRATSRQRIPAATASEVRKVSGVDQATPFLIGEARFIQKNNRDAVQALGTINLGISWAGGNSVGPARLVEGRRPVRDGEVAMDAGTAKRNGFAVGDPVRMLLTGAAEPFRIVGIVSLGDREDLGFATVAAFDPKTAERAFGATGLADFIFVRADAGTNLTTLSADIQRAVGPALTVKPAAEFAAVLQRQVDDFLSLLNDMLLGFAGIGLLIGGFIIFNTFTILIAQRTRELGLLRAMGASSRQIVGSVLAEAVIMGVIASVVGFAAGVGLGRVLLWALPGFGVPVPARALVVINRTIVASAIVGVGVTALAAVFPAIRAARTPPIAAIGDLRTTTKFRSTVGRIVSGVLVTGVGTAVGAYGVWGPRPLDQSVALTFLGGFVIFVGIVVLGPLCARPLAAVIGRPLPTVFGVTGTLARGNAMRNPRRTTVTAAALVVGLALVALVSIFGASLKASARTSLYDVRAQVIITSPGYANFSTDVRERARKVKGVTAAVAFKWGSAGVAGNEEIVNGITPKGFNDVIDFKFRGRAPNSITPRQVLISGKEADSLGLGVGDMLTISFPRLGPSALEVAGVYETRRFSGAFPIDFLVSESLHATAFGSTPQDTLLYLRTQPGMGDQVARTLKSSLARSFPNVDVQTLREYGDSRQSFLDQFLNIFVALLLLSELIAVLGIVNTLMLSVYERTRELGLLRTVGTTRRQVWGMVSGESVIIAVLGCVVGIGVGLLWGWGVMTALRGEFTDAMIVPVGQLGWFVVASVGAGFVAALLPAWHASRLDVLEAIAYE